MKKLELLFKEEVFAIVGAAMEVHRSLGRGFLEGVYQDCLAMECELRGIPFVAEPKLEIRYKGKLVNRWYTPDFLMYGEIVVEIKAAAALCEEDQAQILNALKASGKQVGLLMNFGEKSLAWRRFVRTQR